MWNDGSSSCSNATMQCASCKGVCCDEDGSTILSLDLSHNNLAGSLPSSIFTNLHGLESIDLHGNKLSNIPDDICSFLIEQDDAVFCDLSLNPFDGNHCPPCKIVDSCKLPVNTTCTGGSSSSPGSATNVGRVEMFALFTILILLQLLFCIGCSCVCISGERMKLHIERHKAKAQSSREERLLNSSDSGSDHGIAMRASRVSMRAHVVRARRSPDSIIAVALLATNLLLFIAVFAIVIAIFVVTVNSRSSDGSSTDHDDSNKLSDLFVALCLFGAFKLDEEATKQCAEWFAAWHFAVIAAVLYELVSVPLQAGLLWHVERMPFSAALSYAFTHPFWCCAKRGARARATVHSGGSNHDDVDSETTQKDGGGHLEEEVIFADEESYLYRGSRGTDYLFD
tara:strand:+ start:1462 stop:2652 length:1191 start_codon:yes stop_codon:yes gene_type:complete